MVAECLAPRGRIFFADDAYRTPDELIEGESSTTIRRRLEDGTPVSRGEGSTHRIRSGAALDGIGLAGRGPADARPVLLGLGLSRPESAVERRRAAAVDDGAQS